MPTVRRQPADPPPPLHWDGTALQGTATTRAVVVTVPVRLVALRREILPPAPVPALKAAVALKAERAFAVLGPVAIDAILYPPCDGHCAALLMALPRPVVEAIRTAVADQGRMVSAIRVAEFQVPVPVGGVVEVAGERSLVATVQGGIRAVTALGRGDSAEGARMLARERVRLGVAEDAPAAPASAQQADFLNPTLTSVQPWLARRGMRAALLAAALGGLLILFGLILVWDALADRNAIHADAQRLDPVASALAGQRADLKEVAGWFTARPPLATGLAVLATALPALGSDDQVRLVRVRQIPGEDGLAEGVAADRAQMLGFIARLRRDPRVAAAEVRTFRTPTKGSTEVAFEMVFRLKAGGGDQRSAGGQRQGGSHAGT